MMAGAESVRDAGRAPVVPQRWTSQSLIPILFVASGAAGLIYEVVWSRELVLVFGNTTQAVSTIVTAFMAGLGFGGLAGGWLARRINRPLRLYGFLELLIAALGFSLPLAFASFADVYRSAYASLHPDQLGLFRFGLAFLSISPATFVMGMSLPLLVQHMVTDLDTSGRRIGELYAANTLGAMAGTMLAGLVLIELLGLQGASRIAVLLNLGAGLGGLALSRLSGISRAPARLLGRNVDWARKAPYRGVILSASFASGLAALALEVLWTRRFAEGTGSTIYVFVDILTIYLLGIGAGSLAYRTRGRQDRDNLTTLGVCLAGVGLVAALTVVSGSGVVGVHVHQASWLLLLPATTLMGYAFPLSVRLLMPSAADAGSSAGLLYASNTAGAIIGSFAAAFVLAPTLGTNVSILMLAAIELLLGATLAAIPRARRPQFQRSMVAAAGLMAAVTVAVAVTGQAVTRTDTQNRLLQDGRLAAHTEDFVATVDAEGGALSQRHLYVAGVGMTALTVDTKLMAYVPKAYRPDAQDFLVIAFGMGSTYRSSLILGLKTDAVELSPSVPGLMRYFYSDAEAYLHHPNGRVIIGDGRSYLHLTQKQYDLIAVDPPPPIESAGTVLLYTREFLEEGKARLKPEGVFLLFVPYEESLSDFRDHARTFRSVFAHVDLMFSPGRAGVYMIGSQGPLKLDEQVLAGELGSPGAQADLDDAPDTPHLSGAGWARLISGDVWLRDAQVNAFSGPGPLITDDRPRTEYFLLRRAFGTPSADITEDLLRQASRPIRVAQR